ncbi:hypothetical protein [Oligoflexus tunisiensis]|uniref:hypothetical protein n=1 Tax=Oligoflexus tunisiensis TaxID=708132 RepID=UPI00114D3192|nr:hypothetical protein [Oligoflexus tunisiensis]
MGQALQLILWIGIVGQLLLGIRLVGEASGMWAEAFRVDYELMVCGRYQAMAANLRDAVTTWRKLGCAGEEDLPAEEEVETVLLEWREHYGGRDLEDCGDDGPMRVRLHRERNPDLDEDYPNWVVRYE